MCEMCGLHMQPTQELYRYSTGERGGLMVERELMGRVSEWMDEMPSTNGFLRGVSAPTILNTVPHTFGPSWQSHWLAGQTDGQTDGQMDKWTAHVYFHDNVCLKFLVQMGGLTNSSRHAKYMRSAHVYLRLFVHPYTHVHTPPHTHTLTHSHIHPHTHTYTYWQKRSRVVPWTPPSTNQTHNCWTSSRMCT